MAALTGATNVPVEPGKRKTGPKLIACPEASAQTFPLGALLIKSAGLIQLHTTGYVSVSLFGFAAQTGRNGTADGAKTARVFRCIGGQDDNFKAMLSGTWSTSLRGGTAAISQNTAGVVQLVTATSASDSSVVRLLDAVDPFANADVNPVVFFVPLAAKVQEG